MKAVRWLWWFTKEDGRKISFIFFGSALFLSRVIFTRCTEMCVKCVSLNYSFFPISRFLSIERSSFHYSIQQTLHESIPSWKPSVAVWETSSMHLWPQLSAEVALVDWCRCQLAFMLIRRDEGGKVTNCGHGGRESQTRMEQGQG